MKSHTIVFLASGKKLRCTGPRRDVLLVEAPRSCDLAAASHVEAVAREVAALPQTRARCSARPSLSGIEHSEASPEPFDATAATSAREQSASGGPGEAQASAVISQVGSVL